MARHWCGGSGGNIVDMTKNMAHHCSSNPLDMFGDACRAGVYDEGIATVKLVGILYSE